MSSAEAIGIGIGLFLGYKIRKHFKSKKVKKSVKKKKLDNFIYDDKI